MKLLFGSSSAREDLLEEIEDFPQSSTGAPLPVVLSNEHRVFLCYYVQNVPDGWDGSSVKMVGTDTDDESVAIVSFAMCDAYKFGPPNDEAISGHPLYKKGLRAYSVFKVSSSSWIAELERMNSVHPYHDKKRFDALSHFIFVFHDSTFECIAESGAFEVRAGSIRSVVRELVDRL